MNKRQSKKLARTHWKKFFSEELTRMFLPHRKIKPSQVRIKEEAFPDKKMIKITGAAAGRGICIELIDQHT